MLLAIAAPHSLILDDLTNYLDIESHEALDDALNNYEGWIILVSRNVHFVEMVADRLWLVENGSISILIGGVTDFQKCLLVKRVALKMASKDKLETKTTEKQLSIGCQRRQNTRLLRSKIRGCEKQLDAFSAQKRAVEI